ncbi:MAG: tyrosine--tRNA ligase [Patescibacteria group bacterium]|nr:tyrosine--tRNA ligase [Patescibacteria group bacterium]
MISTNNQKIKNLLTRGVENIYPSADFLESKLKSGQKLKLYLGIDPTGPDLHLGHAIPLMKMREFQELGHQVIVLIGDFTGQIGDPTGKQEARQILTYQQVKNNAKNYKKQISKILNLRQTKFEYNSRWWNKMKLVDFLKLSTHFTVQQTLNRDMFKKRMEKEKDLYLNELYYPLMQAYDSVAMGVDGEIGGNDQMFNMLAGRTLMKKLKDKEKFVLTTKLLEDPTGKKMGKTEGNMITLKDSPQEMFGKIMSWPDEMILPGFELCTRLDLAEITKFKQAMDGGVNPRDYKIKLALEVVAFYHGVDKAKQAEVEFAKIFKNKDLPDEMSEFKVQHSSMDILDLLVATGLVKSKGQARRLIEQKGVKIDQQVVNGIDEIEIKNNMVLQVGKRQFVRLVLD